MAANASGHLADVFRLENARRTLVQRGSSIRGTVRDKAKGIAMAEMSQKFLKEKVSRMWPAACACRHRSQT